MNTLRDLIFRRVNMREQFLAILLDFTHDEIVSVRNNAIRIAKSLHDKDEFRQPIEVRDSLLPLEKIGIRVSSSNMP